MSDIVSYEFSDNTAIIIMDDGKVNSVSYTLIDGLNQALDKAEADSARAIVIVGREGKFSAGFDLKEMMKGPQQALSLLTAGAQLGLRLNQLPVSLVMGATGHAIAMGAIYLMTADEVIGAEGNFKIGLNEVAIGMILPEFACILARERLAKPYLYKVTASAELLSPEHAVAAGFFDQVVSASEVVEQAIARGKYLAATLDPKALAGTKKTIRAECNKLLIASLENIEI